MSETRSRNVGSGIVKTSGRPIRIHVAPDGEWWICDKDAQINGFDFAGSGCAPHSEVHLVK